MKPAPPVRKAISEARVTRGWTKKLLEDETKREAQARVARDIIYGKRCRRCHLLRPCDHS